VGGEVFHHVVGRSEISRHDTDRETGGIDGGGGGRKKGEENVEVPGRATWNLECGARHGGLWMADENDVEGGEKVKKLVSAMVERGECPVDEVGEERRWKGCE
jgi:hypothetical protein